MTRSSSRRNIRCWTRVVLFWGLVFEALWVGGTQGYEGWRCGWSGHPSIIEVDTTEDAYKVGDILGDVGQRLKLSFASRLIDSIPDVPKVPIECLACNSGGKILCVGLVKWPSCLRHYRSLTN
jgi:hypothetical protein